MLFRSARVRWTGVDPVAAQGWIARVPEAQMIDRIARRAAQHEALGISDTRGVRFAQVWSGSKGPDFADMAAVPRWLMLRPDQQEKVAQAVGLLRHRARINRELSGPRLAMLADAVGEDLLDAVCASECVDEPPSDAHLPRPDLIISEGWDVMRRGLPTIFVARYPDANGDQAARALSEQAVVLVEAL